MVKRTAHLSRADAMKMTPAPDTALISITDGHQCQLVERRWRGILRLDFADTSDPFAERTPLMEHAWAVYAFVHENWDRSIMVHCEAGACRSAAVALMLEKLGWSLQNRQLASGANPRLLCLLMQAFNTVVELPQPHYKRVNGMLIPIDS